MHSRKVKPVEWKGITLGNCTRPLRFIREIGSRGVERVYCPQVYTQQASRCSPRMDRRHNYQATSERWENLQANTDARRAPPEKYGQLCGKSPRLPDHYLRNIYGLIRVCLRGGPCERPIFHPHTPLLPHPTSFLLPNPTPAQFATSHYSFFPFSLTHLWRTHTGWLRYSTYA